MLLSALTLWHRIFLNWTPIRCSLYGICETLWNEAISTFIQYVLCRWYYHWWCNLLHLCKVYINWYRYVVNTAGLKSLQQLSSLTYSSVCDDETNKSCRFTIVAAPYVIYFQILYEGLCKLLEFLDKRGTITDLLCIPRSSSVRLALAPTIINTWI